MNDAPKRLTYRFHLQCGDDLRALLEQPYISATILKNLLRKRGTFINTQDKNTLMGHLMLTYLTPQEFDYLMTFAIEREEKKKARNDYDVLNTQSAIGLAQALPSPTELNLRKFVENNLPHCELEGNPTFVKITDSHYRLSAQVNRRNLHSTWIKSEQTFPFEVNVIEDTKQGVLKIQTWHTSEETRKLTRSTTRTTRTSMTHKGHVVPNSTKTIRFNSFSNAERIAFLMKYTSDFTTEDFEFVKLEDLSLRLDENTSTTDSRLTWMKDKVSKLNVSGSSLEDTFFVTDASCRDHLHVWYFECRYKFETIQGKGSAVISFEFGGFAKSGIKTAPFQIKCSRLNTSKYKGCSKTLERKLISRLNDYQLKFYHEVCKKHTPSKGLEDPPSPDIEKPTTAGDLFDFAQNQSLAK